MVKEAAESCGDRLDMAFEKRLAELKRDRKVIPMDEGELMIGNAQYRRERREGGDALYNESKPGIIDSFNHIADSRMPLGIPAAFSDFIEQLARSYKIGSTSITSKRAERTADRWAKIISERTESVTVVVLNMINNAQTPADLKKAFEMLQKNMEGINKIMDNYRRRMRSPI